MRIYKIITTTTVMLLIYNSTHCTKKLYTNTENKTMQIVIDQIKECVICSEEKPINKFVQLQCNHILCISCLNNLANHTENNDLIPCPFCRSTIILSSGQVIIGKKNTQEYSCWAFLFPAPFIQKILKNN